MGFPSPAADYVEPRLTINRLCNIDANCEVIETSDGYAVTNRSSKAKPGNSVLIEQYGKMLFAKVNNGGLLTEAGPITGDALNDVKMLGVVTHFIVRALNDESPV